MKTLKVIKSTTPPSDTNVVWVNGNEVSVFTNNGWEIVNKSKEDKSKEDNGNNKITYFDYQFTNLDIIEDYINSTYNEIQTGEIPNVENFLTNKVLTLVPQVELMTYYLEYLLNEKIATDNIKNIKFEKVIAG